MIESNKNIRIKFSYLNRKKLSQGCWIIASKYFIRVFTLFEQSDNITAIAHDSSIFVVGQKNQLMQIQDVFSLKCLKDLIGHSGKITSILISKDSSLIFSSSDEKTIRMWSVSTGLCEKVQKGHSMTVHSIALSQDSSILVSGSMDQTIRIWDVKSELVLIQIKEQQIICLALNNDSSLFVASNYKKSLKIFDVATGKCKNVLEGHSSQVRIVKFNQDSTLVISAGSYDCTIRIWDSKTGNCINVLKGIDVYQVALCKDSNMILTSSGDKDLSIWDAESSESVVVGYHPNVKCSLVMDINSQIILTFKSSNVIIHYLTQNTYFQ